MNHMYLVKTVTVQLYMMAIFPLNKSSMLLDKCVTVVWLKNLKVLLKKCLVLHFLLAAPLMVNIHLISLIRLIVVKLRSQQNK